MRLRMFTIAGCSRCHAMKSRLNELGLSYEEVYADEPDGLAMAAFHEVMSLPVLQVLDDRGFCVKRIHRAEDIGDGLM